MVHNQKHNDNCSNVDQIYQGELEDISDMQTDFTDTPIISIMTHVLCLNSGAENTHTLFFFSHDGKTLFVT